MSLAEAREHFEGGRHEEAVRAYLAVGREELGGEDEPLDTLADWPATASELDGEPIESLTALDLHQEASALFYMGKTDAAMNVAWSALNAALKQEKDTEGMPELGSTARRSRMLLIACGCNGNNEVDKRIWEIRNIRDQIRNGVAEVDFNVKAPFGDMPE